MNDKNKDRDIIGEVIAEDAERRKGIAYKPLGNMVQQSRAHGGTFVPVKDYDELRQQLAEVSHERDLLRSLLKRVIDSSVLAFEQDGPEEFESLEADICAALKPSAEVLA